MKLNRTRIAALGASAILILGGATVALAQDPSAQPTPVAPQPAGEEPVTGPDTDNIQEGDQTGVDEAGGAEDAADGAHNDADEDAADGAHNDADESESAAESDGPGGHADPEGADTNHQAEGEE